MIRNLGLAVLSMAVALIAVELALRLVGAFEPFPYPPQPRWTELFGPHPEFGYALHPGRTTPFEYPPAEPRTTRITANSDGFRQERDLSEVDGRPRLLVLGDSYTFGIGVEEGERFTDLVEQAVPRLRLDNLAIPGWGPDMMLFAAESVVDRLDADYVVLALFYDDFRRVRHRYSGLGFTIPRLELSGDSLVRRPYPRPGLVERSHLYEALMRALYGENRIRSGPSEAEWEINRRILDRFRSLGDRKGFETVLLYLAGPWSGTANDRRREWVRGYAERQGLPLLDLTDAIHPDTAGVFLPQNAHYSPLGHRRVAARLAPFLDSLTAVDDGP